MGSWGLDLDWVPLASQELYPSSNGFNLSSDVSLDEPSCCGSRAQEGSNSETRRNAQVFLILCIEYDGAVARRTNQLDFFGVDVHLDSVVAATTRKPLSSASRLYRLQKGMHHIRTDEVVALRIQRHIV